MDLTDYKLELDYRVVELYNAGFYDQAAHTAFIALEACIRERLGSSKHGIKLINDAFNPENGLLADWEKLSSEREGIFQLFRGAFLTYRNPVAHRFVNMGEWSARDVIILVNRLFLIIQATSSSPTSKTTTASQPDGIGLQHRPREEALMIDVDGDGVKELVVAAEDRRSAISVYRTREGKVQELPVSPLRQEVYGDFIAGADLMDITGNGTNELITVFSGTSANCLLIHNVHMDGCEPLERPPVDVDSPYFVEALVQDIDQDRRLEIVEERWGSIPDDLDPPVKESISGYVRYIWRWNGQKAGFDLLSRTLLSLGGR